ncbi:MAG: hypothetical protein ACD_3C00188G0013 [uncultured bacterium (gcode 4)]|uniref:Uncharacterized protein n=1 Tax=uncultured bacterium (gcode 4) TaxID=1234023 RepID=K2G0B3_9BACT|nr:MAG: hypothetical protein ACD_3C00188G0013 [uncultured bacterium (gcode 4)]
MRDSFFSLAFARCQRRHQVRKTNCCLSKIAFAILPSYSNQCLRHIDHTSILTSQFSILFGWEWGIRTPDGGVKVRCLTAWLIPNMYKKQTEVRKLYTIFQKVKRK